MNANKWIYDTSIRGGSNAIPWDGNLLCVCGFKRHDPLEYRCLSMRGDVHDNDFDDYHSI